MIGLLFLVCMGLFGGFLGGLRGSGGGFGVLPIGNKIRVYFNQEFFIFTSSCRSP